MSAADWVGAVGTSVAACFGVAAFTSDLSQRRARYQQERASQARLVWCSAASQRVNNAGPDGRVEVSIDIEVHNDSTEMVQGVTLIALADFNDAAGHAWSSDSVFDHGPRLGPGHVWRASVTVVAPEWITHGPVDRWFWYAGFTFTDASNQHWVRDWRHTLIPSKAAPFPKHWYSRKPKPGQSVGVQVLPLAKDRRSTYTDLPQSGPRP